MLTQTRVNELKAMSGVDLLYHVKFTERMWCLNSDSDALEEQEVAMKELAIRLEGAETK